MDNWNKATPETRVAFDEYRRLNAAKEAEVTA